MLQCVMLDQRNRIRNQIGVDQFIEWMSWTLQHPRNSSKMIYEAQSQNTNTRNKNRLKNGFLWMSVSHSVTVTVCPIRRIPAIGKLNSQSQIVSLTGSNFGE
mmetsp:Transcript_670/g.1207  ORF Transcript_670/g.1207 Transcript_670/m.1207 type:complete len:102 (+) Transcript_670:713-1018(+)